LSVREAADILELSPQRVGFYIRRGDLPVQIINGLDYVLLRQDVMHFKEQRDSGKRRTKPGRPGPAELAARRQERDIARRRRQRLEQLRAARATSAAES
jgi:hypothetical protein